MTRALRTRGLQGSSRYADLLYARGYLIGTMAEPRLPRGWLRHGFGEWSVWRDPRLPYAEAAAPPGRLRGPGPRLACLGVILDADRPEDDPHAVLARLALALRRSEDAFLDALDTIAGRHVLLYEAGGRAHVVTDAAGTKQAYRHGGETPLVSSHAKLIVRNAGPRKDPVPPTFKFGYPGLETEWRDVRLLTPNTRLRLDDMEVRRFWPRRALRPVSVADAAEEVARLMEGTLRHLSGRLDLVISITAGLDSRVSLALTRDLAATLFTFYRHGTEDADSLDLAFAKIFAEDSGREVRRLAFLEMTMPRDFAALLDGNTLASHARPLAWAFHSEFPQASRAIHIRSNVSEVGRQFYGTPRWSDPPQGRDLARLYYRGGRDQRPIREVFEAIERFERFAEVNGILRCGEMVDLASLLYWEHRMASWFGNCLVETDVGMDSVSPYNCRRLLALLLSVPEPDREASSVHRRIVATRAPELTRYPVNGEALWS